jgi:histidine triad (HIT) family protein
MSDCLFCKIIKGEIPSEKVFENETVLGFKDISPLAKEHYLFIHKEHTVNINDMADEDPDQIIEVYDAISQFTKDHGLTDGGFRVVTNYGPNAGQTVFHTHFHVLGGEKLRGFGA